MNPLVKKLEERLLPDFESVAEKIRTIISDVSVQVYSSSIGSLTEFQGHDFWIDCIFIKPISETDNVALGVELCHITTIPRIYAGVTWGSPHVYTEASFYDIYPESESSKWAGSFTENGLKVSDEVLEDLYKDLPRLYEALFEALKRRKPPVE